MLPTTMPNSRVPIARTDSRAMAHPYTPILGVVHQHIMPPFYQLHCRYRSKLCLNLRAQKRDGTLHRYCEDHRQRANDNQKKWAQRRMQNFNYVKDAGAFIAPKQEPDHLPEGSHTFDVDEWKLPPILSSEENCNQWAEDNQEGSAPFVADEMDCELLCQALGINDDTKEP